MKTYTLKNGENLIIRKAIKKDASKIVENINQIASESDFLTFGENEFDMTIDKEEKIIEDINSSNNQLFIISEINNKIIGSLIFRASSRPRIQHTGEFGISLLKDYWNLSIGTQLIKYLINWANNSNIIKKINLKVRLDNKHAINLYSKLGFVKEGTITRYLYINNKFYDVILMGLKL